MASLLKLCCCQEPDTNSTAHISPPSINATITTSSIPNKFISHTPDKAVLVRELVGETKSPEKVMLVLFDLGKTRNNCLLAGSKVFAGHESKIYTSNF